MSEENILLVAEDSSNQVVGFLHATIANTLHYYPSVEVCALVVSSQKRHQGIGRMLMVAAENWAQEKGFSIVWLRSNIRREDAHKFYESHGYDIKGTSYFFEKKLKS